VIERVLIVDEFQTMGHRVIVIGRPYPGAPTHYMLGDGTWEPVSENATPIDPSHSTVGFRLPEGALDAIVAEYQKVAAPQPATERHLTDALATRDRLLAMVEVAFRPTASMPPPKLVSE